MFWAKHTLENGKKLNYTKICEKLQVERKKRIENVDRELVETIKAFWDGNLEGAGKIFEYKKKGKKYTMQKVEKITSRWREQLVKDAGLEARWQEWLKENGINSSSTD